MGVNLPGFTWGDENGAGNFKQPIAGVPPSQIEWVKNQGGGMIRFPISPPVIFKTTPTGKTDGSEFNEAFLMKTAECKETPWYPRPCNYLKVLIQATNLKIFSILDVHYNTYHLCGFGDSPMTPEVFKNMWKQIVRHVIKNIPNHQYVMFELFNEPVDYKCGSLPGNWDSDYTIPTIQAIREVENELESDPHVIIATTYGDYSGVHHWSNQLRSLAKTLDDHGYGNSSSSGVVIAGHQYCNPPNFDGAQNQGCDSRKFSEDEQEKWITETDQILNRYGIKWILTEGNVTCSKDGTQCDNSDLWLTWLDKLKNSETCIGATIWFIGINGDSGSMQNEMGSPGTEPGAKKYSDIYSDYDFRKFNS